MRHKSSNKFYDPNTPMQDFRLDLKFIDLKMFKNELVEFSTKKGFEFKYVKNDALRVRAICSAKGCTWLILCSYCNGEKLYVIKHYVQNHSCTFGTTRNKRVIAPVISRRFGDIIAAMPFIKPRHLKALVRRELGVFIGDKVCRNAKRLAIRRIKQQFIEDFVVLNNYAMELKETNPGSNVEVAFERQNPNELPLFKKIYICLHAMKEGFLSGCRRLISVDGCFLKE